jgi:hypothetical protein
MNPSYVLFPHHYHSFNAFDTLNLHLPRLAPSVTNLQTWFWQINSKFLEQASFHKGSIGQDLEHQHDRSATFATQSVACFLTQGVTNGAM